MRPTRSDHDSHYHDVRLSSSGYEQRLRSPRSPPLAALLSEPFLCASEHRCSTALGAHSSSDTLSLTPDVLEARYDFQVSEGRNSITRYVHLLLVMHIITVVSQLFRVCSSQSVLRE